MKYFRNPWISSACFALHRPSQSVKSSRRQGLASIRMGIAKDTFKRPLMRRIASCLIPIFGLIWIATQLGCQGPTLVTGPGPSSFGPVNGMLYYLPIGKITIKGEYAQPEGTPKPRELTITLTAEVEADEGAGVYYVTPQSNYIYEDEVRVAVNAKHLLSTGNVTTEDKTAEIAGALASLARAGLGLAKTEALENQRPFNVTFHPSN